MMKKILLIGILFSTLSGCDKNFLDTKPHNAISSANLWNSDGNATMAINGIYGNIRLENAYGNFTFKFTNWGPDGIHYNGGTIMQGRADAGSGDFERKYKWNYQVIGRCNDAIFHLTDNTAVTAELRDRFIAEAKFIRGFCYFELWALYGGVAILDKPVDIAGSYLPRNTADEVKAFLIQDFTDAVAGLPVVYSSQNDLGRVTRGAAQSMLGKVYVYSQEWPKAVEELGKLTQAPYTYALWPDYGQLFDVNTERNSEVIFDVEAISETDLGSQNDMRYGGRSLLTSGWSETCASWATIASYTNQDGSPIDISDMPKRDDYASDYLLGLDLIPWYQNKYKNADKRLHMNVIMPGSRVIGVNGTEFMMNWPYGEHANDVPYPAYQLDETSKAGIPWRKYIGTDNESTVRWDANTNIVLIRYADVLLLWAEAKNEAEGPSQAIYDVVNAIRDRGNVPHIAGLSKEDLRQEIRMERLRELPGEGQLFFDVRRWKTAASTDQFFGLNKVENDFRLLPLWTRVFTERYYLWAIPYDEILMNKNMTQNPGWEQ